jgi:putative flavoprotein involved in K+ transport
MTVTRVEAGRSPDTYLVTTAGADGDTATIETRHVVLACGGQRAAKRPAIAERLPPTVHQIHTSEYRSPEALPGGAVLVVGSAQSGVQVTEDLVLAGRTTYLATSRVGRLRRRYRGRDALDHLVSNGFYDMTPEQLADPAMKALPIPLISGVGRYGHSVSLQWLAGLGVRLAGRPVDIEGDRVQFDDSLGATIAEGDRTSAMFRDLIDRGLEAAGDRLAPIEPDPADDSHPDPLSVHGPASVDMDADGISTVIWATGYAADFSFVGVPVLDDAGLPIHDRGAAPIPGIHFLGLRWQTKRKSALITAADEESGQLAERIASQSVAG